MGIKEAFGFGAEAKGYKEFLTEMRDMQATLDGLVRRHGMLLTGTINGIIIDFERSDRDVVSFTVPLDAIENIKTRMSTELGKEIKIVKDRMDARIHKESNVRK